MTSAGSRLDVLFLIRTMGRGGAERQLGLLARALSARGLKIAVAVFYGGGPLEQELRDAGVELFDLKKTGRWSNAQVIRSLLGFVSARQPRVLHSYMATQNVFALLLGPWLRRQGCAVACGIRTALPSAWRYSKIAGLMDAMQLLLLPSAERVISNSSRALDVLQDRIAPDRAFAIPNGVECERFVFIPESRERQRAEWGLRQNDVVVGLVARLDPQKNHKLLLDALRLAGEAMPEVRIVFVGSGPLEYQVEVEAHARTLGLSSRTLWVGASDALSAVYSALDLLCLCSVTEGFPNVLAEAMCAGLPCVTTDVGDAKVLVGDCGWVVPSGDAEALARALLHAYRALPSWNRERPRRRMVEHFSVETLADRTIAALAPFLRETAR